MNKIILMKILLHLIFKDLSAYTFLNGWIGVKREFVDRIF